jgi:hypothetical protein
MRKIRLSAIKETRSSNSVLISLSNKEICALVTSITLERAGALYRLGTIALLEPV